MAADADRHIAAFLRQVGTGRLDEVRAALAADPSLVNAIGPHPFWGGRPQPLHVAIETKRRPMIDLLIAHGADVNGTNDQYDHWSPLMLAMDRRQDELRAELIARGARVGLIESLMLADDARVEALLRADGLPAMAPNRGSMLAFARTPFAIDRLLALGALAQTVDRWGSTPIDALSRLGPRGAPLVQRLVEQGVPAAPQEYARMNDRETLGRLIEADPSVARQPAVLMGAVDFRHHDLAEWLLARGADANTRVEGQSQQTALHSAAWNGDLRMVQLLIAAGADPAACDGEHNATPLGWAETSLEITSNQACAEVIAWLQAPPGR